MPTFKDKRGVLHRRGAASRYADGREGEVRVDVAPAVVDEDEPDDEQED